MNLYTDSEALAETLSSLETIRSTDEREEKVKEIRIHLESAARELSIERFSSFESSLFQTIFSFVDSNDLLCKKAGIRALQELTDCTSSATEKKIISFAGCISNALLTNSDFDLIEIIAGALGHVARFSVISSHVEYVEKELDRSLEWLRDDVPHHRLAACAILHELAENAPSIFFTRSRDFFVHIWGPLRDNKNEIRFAAARALSACLAVLSKRKYHLQFYCNVYDQICHGLKMKSKEELHGSLIVIVEMLRHTGGFMIPRFREMCSGIMLLKNHPSRTVRSAIIALIPELASFCPDSFARVYLDEAIDMLIKGTDNNDLRPQSMISIGRLSLSIGSHPRLIGRVNELAVVVRKNLSSNLSKKEVLQCISNMVVGIGPFFHSYVLEMLDTMLRTGLTSDLIDTLAVVAGELVSHQDTIQRKLMNEVFKILGWDSDQLEVGGNSYIPMAANSWYRSPEQRQRPKQKSSSGSIDVNKSSRKQSEASESSVSPVNDTWTDVSEAKCGGQFYPPPTRQLMDYFFKENSGKISRRSIDRDPDAASSELILLCLKTLGTLYTPHIGTQDTMRNIYHTLLPMVQHSVLPYLESSNSDIRKEVVMTATNLITSPAEPLRTRGPVAVALEDVIGTILQAAVSDPVWHVRLAALRSLRTPLESYLSQEHHIDSLMFLLSDEVMEIRIDALALLGRLAPINPAKVLPGLRLILLHLIGELNCSCDNRTKEEATTLLCHFLRVNSLHVIVKSYMKTLVSAVQPTASYDVRLTTACLEAMGELCMVMRSDMEPFVESFMPVIMSNMYNSTSRRKQETSVRTLGQLVTAVGLVSKPYFMYPDLLPKALELLKAFIPWHVRREVLRTLGLLGALEPRKYALIQEYHSRQKMMKKLGEKKRGHTVTHETENLPTTSSHINKRVVGDPVDMQLTRQVQRDRTHSEASVQSSDTSTLRDSDSVSKKLSSSSSSKGEGIILDEESEDAPAHLYMYAQTVTLAQPTPEMDPPTRLFPYADDYYPRMAISALLKVLRDPGLGVHHSAVIQTIMNIFKSLGVRCVPYLSDVLPYLLMLAQTCSHGLRESIIQQLVQLVATVHYHISSYLEMIFDIICNFWTDHLEYVLNLFEEIAFAVPDDLAQYLPRIVPLLLSTLTLRKTVRTYEGAHIPENTPLPILLGDNSFMSKTPSPPLPVPTYVGSAEAYRDLESALLCIDRLCVVLRSQAHLIIPQICKLIPQLCDHGVSVLPKLVLSVDTLRKICVQSAIAENGHLASRVLHCLVDLLQWINTQDWTYIMQDMDTPAFGGFFQFCGIGGKDDIEEENSPVDNINALYMTMDEHGVMHDTHNDVYGSNGQNHKNAHDTVGQLAHTVVVGIFAIGVQLKERIFTFENLIRTGFQHYPLPHLEPKLNAILKDIKKGDLSIPVNLVELEKFMLEHGYIDFKAEEEKERVRVIKLLHKKGLKGNNLNSKIVKYMNVFTLRASSHSEGVSSGLLLDRSNRREKTNQTNIKVQVNQMHLQRAWDVTQRSTASDWNEWLRRLITEMIRESSSPVLRCCSAMAQSYAPLGKDLFHAAFVSCWQELTDQNQESLIKALHVAFSSSSIPPEILQTLLNLAEYLEHDFEPLPIQPSILAELAQKSHAYAKALHYREQEFQSSPASCFESLININKKLDQHDAAIGVLKVVVEYQKTHQNVGESYTVQESWLAKLGQWKEALHRYDTRLDANPKEVVAIIGKLKCLDALGRWNEAIELCMDNLELLRSHGSTRQPVTSDKIGDHGHPHTASIMHRSISDSATVSGLGGGHGKETLYLEKAAVIGARCAWSLNDWSLMEKLVSELPEDNIDASLMRAVLTVHAENYNSACMYIDDARSQLADNLVATLSESYSRAYVSLIKIQQCSELEEIIEYKLMQRSASGVHGRSSYSHVVRDLDVDDPGTQGASISRNSSFSLPTSPHNRMRKHGSSAKLHTPRTPRGKMSQNHLDRSFSFNFSSEVSFDALDTTSAGNISHHSIRSMGTSVDASTERSRDQLQQEAAKRKDFLAKTWRRRLKACKNTGRSAIGVWKNLLDIRRMVLSEREDLDTCLEFAKLCRHGGNLDLAERVLRLSQPKDGQISSSTYSPYLSSPQVGDNVTFPKAPDSLGRQQDNETNPYFTHSTHFMPMSLTDCKIRFAVLRQRWSVGEKPSAIECLQGLIDVIGNSNLDLNSNELADGVAPSSSSSSSLYLDCLLKLGHWKLAVLDPGVSVDMDTRRSVLALYTKATVMNPGSYRAWHEWGLANYRAADEVRGKADSSRRFSGSAQGFRNTQPSVNDKKANVFLVNAAKGLLRAIALGTRRWGSSVSQDMLAFLSVWFKHGHVAEVYATLGAGLSSVHIDNWLGVLPQLIARIDHHELNARTLLHGLITRLGGVHAQALVYPLSVAVKSPKDQRRRAAESLMVTLRHSNEKLIDQALLVSQELIRVAISWEEDWHEVLEEASRFYFGEGNARAMLDMLLPKHEVLAKGPTTLREASFVQYFGNELQGAWQSLKQYMTIMEQAGKEIPTSNANIHKRNSRSAKLSEEEKPLALAWEIYYSVFKKINQSLGTMNSLELSNISPNLQDCHNLTLGVPGTYSSDGEAVRIVMVKHDIQVIKSKQRPRKIVILGEDGKMYAFLLKGHEDLRQDERAMQLFGLVNALLFRDRRTEDADLSIQRYAVVPLSPMVGLISWVPQCDTLHDLIKDYRESRKIMLNIEHRLMQNLAPSTGFDTLTHPQKLEIFKHALDNTQGEDLAKILWHRSETSEAWLQCRASYTRSLAVMSMVGYVLGLGDRHPSNLMLNRFTGKVLHIDFGDCFEVAMHRDKFPEKVPFRLTRMLVNAMEVSGIEGNYRLTCEKVMSVLRENRDSLIAMLEAFVYDPLISWRLLYTDKVKKNKDPEGEKTKNGEDGNSIVGGSHERRSSAQQRNLETITEVKADDDIISTTGDDEHNSEGRSSKKQPSASSKLFGAVPTVQNLDNSVWQGANSDVSSEQSQYSQSQYSNFEIVPSQPPKLRPLSEDIGATSTSNMSRTDGQGAQPHSDDNDNDENNVPDSTTQESYRRNLHKEMMAMAASVHFGDNTMNVIASSLSRNEDNPSASSLISDEVLQMMSGRSSRQSCRDEREMSATGELQDKAVVVIKRVIDKLNGMDYIEGGAGGRSLNLKIFDIKGPTIRALDVPSQVERLIQQARSNDNLCLSFIGWCPFW